MYNPALIVIGSLNYPKGSAPSNRIHLYCKAFREVNGTPLVINLDSPFNNQQPFDFIGRHEGIVFCFSRKKYIVEKNFFKRNAERLKGLMNTIYIVNKRKKRNANIIVLFFSTLPLDEFILTFFLKLLKIKIVRECNEAPDFIREEKKYIKIRTFFLKNLKLKSYDGIIVISEFLKKYYSNLFSARKIFHIPILVDLDRFKGPFEKRQTTKKIITYVGHMGSNKDGLEDLLASVAIVKRSINNIQLNLVGNAPESEMKLLKRKIEQLKLTDTVCLLGSKESDEIPYILVNSDLLVLARPDNNQAKAGFPTKLGEYLASKKPVIITKTGEIPRYLDDSKSAYLTNPGDIKGFAEKIIYAINDEKADKIGLEGYRIAEKCFDFHLYGDKLIEIFNEVHKGT